MDYIIILVSADWRIGMRGASLIFVIKKATPFRDSLYTFSGEAGTWLGIIPFWSGTSPISPRFSVPITRESCV